MSKASAALRRSGVRLRSIGSGRAPLNLLISEQSNTRQKYKDLIAAQVSLSQSLDQWSQEEENPALQDVLHNVYELNLVWAEAQKDFVVALKEYKRVYENIREMEKKLDATRKQLNILEEKERKLQKELVKGPKDILVTQEKLRQTTDSKSLAQAEVSGLVRETEAVKLMTLRAGLLDLSQSWQRMASKCSIIADSQKDLAVLIPDIGSARVQDLPTYTGTRESNRILYNVRTKLDHMQPPQYGSDYSSYSDPTSPPSYNSSLTRPHSAGGVTNSSGTRQKQKRPSEPLPNTLTARNLDTLGSVDQYYDSFDSYESD